VFEIDLCEECAQKKGMEFKPEIQLADFVSTLVDLGLPTKKEKKVTSCPVCGLTYSEFKRTGRLGCSNCYEVFSFYLMHLLERIHGKTKHIGKSSNVVPKITKSDLQKQRDVLKKKLQGAIKSEQYEKAAELRDKINKLKSSNRKSK
jgi:protein arginine kinase activator